jgi:bacteriorhodopsin
VEHDLTFTESQWDLVLGTLVVTLFALIAGFVYSISTRNEVGAKYRPAMTASSLVLIVATFSYIALVLSWLFGYKSSGGSYVPNPSFQYNNGLRYMDWTVSVPLLTIELVGISVLTGARALRARAILVTSAVLMIVTGFLGEDVFGSRGENDGALWLWGAISTVPFVVAYVYIFKICAESAKALPADVGRTFRNIAFVFAFTWGVYPLAYLVQIFWDNSPAWGVARQLSFSLATIIAKVGYMVLVHKVGKMRTALDVTSGEQSQDDDVWMSSVKLAPARPPLGVYLLEHSDVVRDRLPSSSGVYPEEHARVQNGSGVTQRT